MKPTIVPFIKWVGGKRQLYKEIDEVIEFLGPFKKYHEPFVGGGAIFLAELSGGKEVGSINDLNSDLINCYKVIKDEPLKLMKQLDMFGKNHGRMLFYAIRYMDRDGSLQRKGSVFKAARFIYLNKTGFNGIYRVNLKNQFNVPIGSIGEKKLYSKENIINISDALNNSSTKILNSDYRYVEEMASPGDLVYFDPPYDAFEKQESFVGYQKEGFNRDNQIELKELCDRLIANGVNVIVSNHNTKFINELYDDENYYIKKVVGVSRALNSDAKNRGKKDIEIIVYARGSNNG